MGNAALTYAENVLGVHACYERASAAQKELDEIVTDLDKAQDERRILADAINDREIDLLIAEQGKHPDHSVTALERHMKVVKHKDPHLAELRKQLSSKTSQVNGLEYDLDVQKVIVKMESARMEELGGYFRYLAAIKEAENLAKLQNQENNK